MSGWWHFLPVEVTFTASKDVHLKLGLEGPEVLYLGVVVDLEGESSNIAEGNTDVSIRFGAVEGVTKGLIVRKS